MTWEEKLDALNSLSDCELKMRKPGDWHVLQVSTDIKKGGLLHGSCGNGATPQEAVENHWEIMTNLKPSEYLVLDAMGDRRKAVEWSGFMWKEVPES